MNDLIAQVFEELDEYILKPLGPDEVTPYMLEERDTQGRTAKTWRAIMDKGVRAGKYERNYRRRLEDNKKVVAYRLVKE